MQFNKINDPNLKESTAAVSMQNVDFEFSTKGTGSKADNTDVVPALKTRLVEILSESNIKGLY